MTDQLTLLLFIANWVGLVLWGRLFMLLMEVIICKDALFVNTSRILNTSFIARIRLFKRSFKELFYRSSILLFIGSLVGVFVMVNELYANVFPTRKYLWTIFSIIYPTGTYFLYKSLGFRWTLQDRFLQFLHKGIA